ncbi:12072_t:CDS:1, partial [Racocetra fulgida]
LLTVYQNARMNSSGGCVTKDNIKGDESIPHVIDLSASDSHLSKRVKIVNKVDNSRLVDLNNVDEYVMDILNYNDECKRKVCSCEKVNKGKSSSSIVHNTRSQARMLKNVNDNDDY